LDVLSKIAAEAEDAQDGEAVPIQVKPNYAYSELRRIQGHSTPRKMIELRNILSFQ
jgi:hypothetical protein